MSDLPDCPECGEPGLVSTGRRSRVGSLRVTCALCPFEGFHLLPGVESTHA
jgi:predicted RNA-binding Zn-ribbon protein involved in translation (DUF1610 family)